MKRRGFVAERFAVLEDRVEHHPKHSDENQGADDQHEPMQPPLLFRDFGGSGLQVELVDRRATRQVIDRPGGGGHPSSTPERATGQPSRNVLDHLHLNLPQKIAPEGSHLGLLLIWRNIRLQLSG